MLLVPLIDHRIALTRLRLPTRLAFIAKKLCPELILVETHFARYMEM